MVDGRKVVFSDARRDPAREVVAFRGDLHVCIEWERVVDDEVLEVVF